MSLDFVSWLSLLAYHMELVVNFNANATKHYQVNIEMLLVIRSVGLDTKQ